MEIPDIDITTRNNALVDQLKSAGLISSPQVEAAFRAIPRHLFVPDIDLDRVYRDEVIVTKQSATGAPTSSCEQPAIVAVMLEQLGVQPGQHVLEIGAGTGHVAALLAHIVGPTGRVTTIDIQPDLVEAAREHLAAAGFPQVHVICADGGFGYAEDAPYDRIILTVGSSDLTPAWQEQLQVGGRLVLPLYVLPGVQRSVAFQKTETGLASLSLKPCGFMPLQGAFMAEQLREVELGSEPGLTFVLDHGGTVDAEAIYRLLSSPHRDLATDITVTPRELLGGLGPWLTLNEPISCGVGARGKWLGRRLVPCLLGLANQFCGTGGLMDGAQRLALLARPSDRPLPADFRTDDAPFPLHVISYGPDDVLADRLTHQVETWAKCGHPTFEQTHITAHPRGIDYAPSVGEYLLVRPSIQFVLSWSA